MGSTYHARLPTLNATVFTCVQGERLACGSQVLQHQGSPVGTAVASAGLSQLPEIMVNGRNHGAGMGKEGRQTS